LPERMEPIAFRLRRAGFAAVAFATALSPSAYDPAARRVAARIQLVAARIVERQRQAENQAFAHLCNTLLHFFRREQVEPPDLVVRTEVAPGRAGRPLLPAGLHRKSPGYLLPRT